MMDASLTQRPIKMHISIIKKISKTVYLVFLALSFTSCSAPGVAGPVETSHTTAQVDEVTQLRRSTTPSWVTLPDDVGFKLGILIEFSDEMMTSTLLSRHTIQVDIEDQPADGSLQFQTLVDAHPNTLAVFYTDEFLSDFIVDPNEVSICLTIKGSDGPTTDAGGNVFAFSGAYREADSDDSETVSINTFRRENLLDGDNDGSPGGNYVECWDFFL